MEYIIMLGFVGWLFALISMVPMAPSNDEKLVILDLSFSDEEESAAEFPKAA
ncbi:MAG: hypothetical protein OEZ04_06785 [Nitrospinota bacterium]|nr:hypothetical protein [Nitrospinota bacterium]